MQRVSFWEIVATKATFTLHTDLSNGVDEVDMGVKVEG